SALRLGSFSCACGPLALHSFPTRRSSDLCRCDRPRVEAMLRGLGREEVEAILAEQGEAVVTCEFCRKPYRFDAVDVAGLFIPASTDGRNSLNCAVEAPRTSLSGAGPRAARPCRPAPSSAAGSAAPAAAHRDRDWRH